MAYLFIEFGHVLNSVKFILY